MLNITKADVAYTKAVVGNAWELAFRYSWGLISSMGIDPRRTAVSGDRVVVLTRGDICPDGSYVDRAEVDPKYVETLLHRVFRIVPVVYEKESVFRQGCDYRKLVFRNLEGTDETRPLYKVEMYGPLDSPYRITCNCAADEWYALRKGDREDGETFLCKHRVFAYLYFKKRYVRAREQNPLSDVVFRQESDLREKDVMEVDDVE